MLYHTHLGLHVYRFTIVTFLNHIILAIFLNFINLICMKKIFEEPRIIWFTGLQVYNSPLFMLHSLSYMTNLFNKFK